MLPTELKYYSQFYDSIYSAANQDDELPGETYLIFDRSKPDYGRLVEKVQASAKKWYSFKSADFIK